MAEPTGVIESILAWSSARPDWQQDALRRLMVQGGLTPADKAELLLLAWSWAGIPVTSLLPETSPLRESHFPVRGSGEPIIRLTALREVKGVNALCDDQKLTIEPRGITAIYGENGAGKSGYFRVLKHACQSRAAEPIHGDARSATPIKQSATLEVVDDPGGGVDRGLKWSETLATPELKQFALFDASCGKQIVGSASEPVFLPLGLEVFQPFAALLDEVRGALDAKVQILRDVRHLGAILGELAGDHPVGRMAAAFPNATTTEAIEALATMSAEEREELTSISTRLKELAAADPSTAIAKLQSLIRRAQLERQRLVTFKSQFGDESVQALLEKWGNLKSAREANDLARQRDATVNPLAGVGTPPWKALFLAAREYSVHAAYPGQPFPSDQADALCVLCMQPLSEDASGRLRRFESYIQDRSAKILEVAEAAWTSAYAPLVGATLEPTDGILLDEVQQESKEAQGELVAGTEELRQIHARVVKACGEGVRTVPTALKLDPVMVLDRLIKALVSRLAALGGGKRSEEIAALNRRQADLMARTALSRHRVSLIRAVEQKAIADLAASKLAELRTRSVTEKQKELAETAIAGRYGDALKAELKALEVVRFQLGYKPTGSKGQLVQQLQLPDAAKDLKPEQVLSEGEHKVAALAAFLAEAHLRSAPFTLIFDDPVSSLDHVWSERVARRLVHMAQDRQVIVFTHNLPFLLQLRDAAAETSPSVPVPERVNDFETESGLS